MPRNQKAFAIEMGKNGLKAYEAERAREREYAEMAKKHTAAIKIQKHVRGHLSRKHRSGGRRTRRTRRRY
jgi:hypothetical protein